MSRGHIALLGDSIFDNASYVPGESCLIEQLRQQLPNGWHATLLATDGASTADVLTQLELITPEVTHVFVSAGGNDALNESVLLAETVRTVAEAQQLLAQAQSRFRQAYERLVGAVLGLDRPAALCTVYDAIPGLGEPARVALSVFNDVILRTAFRHHSPVIDLRLICNEAEDYSSVSEIEPSARGGAKIAQIIAEVAMNHDFAGRRSVVYA